MSSKQIYYYLTTIGTEMPHEYISATTQLRTFPILLRLFLSNLNFLLDLLKINMRHLGIITIKDLGQLLESGAPGLNVEEVDKAELDEYPDRVDQRQVPVLRKILPRNWVSVTKMVSFVQRAGTYIQATYFPRTRDACTVRFIIITPLARSRYGKISSAYATSRPDQAME